MARGRPRLVTAKAEVSGAAAHNPGRFADRFSPEDPQPLGDPLPGMGEVEMHHWRELERTMPWLTDSDRTTVRMACLWLARLDVDPESFGTKETVALLRLMSSLGGTPTEISKVKQRAPAQKQTPEARFFGT
jgi:hypothetical protein